MLANNTAYIKTTEVVTPIKRSIMKVNAKTARHISFLIFTKRIASPYSVKIKFFNLLTLKATVKTVHS